MKIDCCLPLSQNLYRTFSGIYDCVLQKIQAVTDKIWHAYNEPSKHVPKLVIPEHPTPNPYPRHYSKCAWPWYLNNAWGKWGDPADVNDIAHRRDPLELVTPLHAVTMGHNEKGLYRILAGGVDLRAKDIGGQTPADFAEYYRILAQGADIEAKDIRGQTPAYWAAYFGKLAMLMKLTLYGASLGHADHRGKTLLRAAVKYGHEDTIAFLASQRVNLNPVDGRGLTPLHLAAYRGRFSTYEKLVFFGADTQIKDPLGRTAEEILRLRYADEYHNSWFIVRLFSSPTPPALSLQPWRVQQLRARVA